MRNMNRNEKMTINVLEVTSFIVYFFAAKSFTGIYCTLFQAERQGSPKAESSLQVLFGYSFP